MLDIFIVHIDENLDDVMFKSLLESLPAEEQSIVTKKIRMQDKQSALLTRVFLRKLLVQKYNLNRSKINFQKNKYGKPFLHEKEELHFNISHSGKYITFVFSDKPVGIDIESERELEPETLANFLHPLEKKHLFRKSGDKYEMFRIWTLKESYIKAVGMGMYKELTSFSVLDKEGKAEIFDTNLGTHESWILSHKMLADTIHLSVCCSKECSAPVEKHYRSSEAGLFQSILADLQD